MSKKLAFIHTVAGPYEELAKELLPNVETMHVMDEILLKTVIAAGEVTPFICRRVAENVISAEQAGADAVQVTCSSVSPCVDVARFLVSIPVLKIDEPMIDKGISLGKCIGIAATSPSTLKPTTELTYRNAELAGKDVQVDSVLCEGAFDALYYRGDTETHDRIVREHLQQMMARNDVVMLAQGSMARVAESIPVEEQTVPILTSPRLALERVRDLFREMTAYVGGHPPAFTMPGAPRRGEAWHRSIYDAVEKDDAQTASDAMQKHMQQVIGDAAAGQRAPISTRSSMTMVIQLTGIPHLTRSVISEDRCKRWIAQHPIR